jgi:Flp pilus assembly protein TadB
MQRVERHHFFHPIEPPPPEDIPVNAPIRDDSHIGATEDLDREPDGVPHSVVGFTALFAVVLAMLLVVLFFSGSTTGRVGAALLLVFAVPVVFGRLKRKADRERDPVHPSR